MKTKLALLTVALSILVSPAFGWPWGNVGIGTTGMPEEKLHVVGNLRIDDGILITTGITNATEGRTTAIIGGDVCAQMGMADVQRLVQAIRQNEDQIPSGLWYYDNMDGDMRMTTVRDDGIEVWGLDRDTTNVVRVKRYSITPD